MILRLVAVKMQPESINREENMEDQEKSTKKSGIIYVFSAILVIIWNLFKGLCKSIWLMIDHFILH